MRSKFAALLLVSLLLAAAAPTSIGKMNGKFSSGSGCGCHYGGSATVSMSGQPSSYNPGTTYTLSISVSNGVSGSHGGFSLDANKGTLTTGGGVGIMAVKVNSAGTSATHTTNSYRSWSVDWIAPSAGSGSVQFNLAGMTANGNSGTGGDAWVQPRLLCLKAVHLRQTTHRVHLDYSSLLRIPSQLTHLLYPTHTKTKMEILNLELRFAGIRTGN